MRHTCSLCQACYEYARPDEYFPYTLRDGNCCGCGDQTYVARVSRKEADEVASIMFRDDADKPHNN